MPKLGNLVGQTFGRLKVVGRVVTNGISGKYICECDCGNTKHVASNKLQSGNTKSCGCLRAEFSAKHLTKVSETRTGKPYIDLTGKRYGRLTVLGLIGLSGNTDNKFYQWSCMCDCGKITKVTGNNLGRNHTTSCGCYGDEIRGKGENNPNYNPELSEEERMLRREYPAYREWRAAVHVRDNYTCQCCGKYGGTLNVHHLEDYASNPELRTSVDNGVTLCKTCHKEFHAIYGTKQGNHAWQFLEFIQTPIAA